MVLLDCVSCTIRRYNVAGCYLEKTYFLLVSSFFKGSGANCLKKNQKFLHEQSPQVTNQINHSRKEDGFVCLNSELDVITLQFYSKDVDEEGAGKQTLWVLGIVDISIMSLFCISLTN